MKNNKNPLREIMKKRNWTYQDFATVTGTSSSTIYKNLEGSNIEINENILETLNKLGYDPEKLKKEYQEYRQQKQKKLLGV